MMLFFVFGDFVKPSVQWDVGKYALVMIVFVFIVNLIMLVSNIMAQAKNTSALKKLKWKNQRVAMAMKRLL